MTTYNERSECGAESVNLSNARTEQQRGVMEAIATDGDCPFCPEHLAKYHKNPIIRTGENWLLTANQWPYENTRVHMLAIAAYHVETLDGLKTGAFEELGDHMRWATREYAVKAGGVAMRFGDTSLTGASVSHLHAHLIVPDPNKPPEAKVKFKIS